MNPEQPPRDKNAQILMDRRKFLGTGATVAGAAAALALSPVSGWAQRPQPLPGRPGTFTRMFDLPPFAEPSSQLERALLELGAPGGIMDAKDPLHEGPVRLITEPELSLNNPNNSSNSAGITFLGQFLDHDMTFDAGSALGVATPPEASGNSRTAPFDLDSVYGGGPVASPQLYRNDDRAKFKVESGGQFEDLPRGSDGAAIIADPRNDENLMIAGLQVAFLKFHNNMVDQLRESPGKRRLLGVDDPGFFGPAQAHNRGNVFAEARRLVTAHYHWVIVHEFLPHVVTGAMVDDILRNGCRYYRPNRGVQNISVEFQGAAYRFGHSLVRPSYRANLAGDQGHPFFAFIFDPAGEGQADPVDLRGGARAPRRFIGWQTFFDFGGDQTQHLRPSKAIDTKLSTPLFNLPLGTIAGGTPPTSLATRNLLRHLTWSLPSGQAIANYMGIPALSPGQLSELAQFGAGLETSTPLWYYILKEAEVAGGACLAGVGARIVAEVFLGLLLADNDCYLVRQPNWRPTLPGRVPGTFTMADLLTYAGVDPASRGQ